MTDRKRVLILGGTGEAVALASEAAKTMDVTYSLAGRTNNPALPDNVTARTGGFGGADALADWLRDQKTDCVVDATHPYATEIAANARTACDAVSLPRLKVMRPAWQPKPDDQWHLVSGVDAAAKMLPDLGQRAFLSVGRQELVAFAGIAGMTFLARTVDPLPDPPLANAIHVTGRGPFPVDGEIDLLKQHEIDVLVSKNSGGNGTYAKIEAARMLSLPVVMIDRPKKIEGDTVETAADALQWLKEL